MGLIATPPGPLSNEVFGIARIRPVWRLGFGVALARDQAAVALAKLVAVRRRFATFKADFTAAAAFEAIVVPSPMAV